NEYTSGTWTKTTLSINGCCLREHPHSSSLRSKECLLSGSTDLGCARAKPRTSKRSFENQRLSRSSDLSPLASYYIYSAQRAYCNIKKFNMTTKNPNLKAAGRLRSGTRPPANPRRCQTLRSRRRFHRRGPDVAPLPEPCLRRFFTGEEHGRRSDVVGEIVCGGREVFVSGGE
ncbi:plant invertase/pectin methylesterase inhibitor, partial [Striga asiatica]